MKSCFAALAALMAALVLASSATAALPQTKSKLIVPGKSVAGVKLGMLMTTAANVWKMEAGHSCFRELPSLPYRCLFEPAPSSASYHLGVLVYEGRKKVQQISIRAPIDRDRPDLNSVMNQYKTAGGIGIGTQLGKLQSTFGKALKLTTPGAERIFTVTGPGKATTEFTLFGIQVRSISLSQP